MTVTRHAIHSSAVSEVAYDDETEVLELKYNSGTYAYSGVPVEVYQGLVASDSPGKFIADHIRDKFTTTKAMF
jgi:hypothetical protein